MQHVLIWGGAGMAGGELLRIAATHPAMNIAGVVSRSNAGRPLWHVHPHLRSAYGDQRFLSPQEARNTETDLVFLALPHGASLEILPFYTERDIAVVDLSADLRLRSSESYARWYGKEHPFPEMQERAVYGLPELHREEIGRSRLISGVGCNATAGILGLYPLAREGVIEDVDMEMRAGSSEGGASPSRGSHHPYRRGVLRVVSFFEHRHLGEILQETGLESSRVRMTLTAAEMVRGVQMFARVRLSRKMKESEIWKIFRSCWKNEPFIDFCPSRPGHLRFPDPRMVLGSNRAQIGFALAEDGRSLLVGSALDNLLKGAAGTAVQGANLMFGLPETSGLEMMPVYPA